MLTCDPSCAHEDFAKPRRRRRWRAGFRIYPTDGVALVARVGFAVRPTGDERGGDEMHPNPISLMSDRLDVPVESDDLGLDADLFHKFAGDRGGERLCHFDDATGEAVMAKQRGAGGVG